jgi:hypothetical protein
MPLDVLMGNMNAEVHIPQQRLYIHTHCVLPLQTHTFMWIDPKLFLKDMPSGELPMLFS